MGRSECESNFGEREAYVEVLGVNVAMLGVEVLLGHEHALCHYIISQEPFSATMHHIPRKRYSWIFLRSSLGMSLRASQQRIRQKKAKAYIVASSWRYSGNRFTMLGERVV